MDVDSQPTRPVLLVERIYRAERGRSHVGHVPGGLDARGGDVAALDGRLALVLQLRPMAFLREPRLYGGPAAALDILSLETS